MYNGYLAMGGIALDDERFEIINTGRALAYVENWNAKVRQGLTNIDGTVGECIGWVQDCDSCPGVEDVLTQANDYFLPEYDPAPWYDPLVPDTARFLGVLGIDVQGAEDSTREARVEQALGGGGAIGRMRFGPRELVVRVVAVAADDCGMEAGLNWLRCQYETQVEPCVGDALWFLDCCPDCANTEQTGDPVGPCWTSTYADLLAGPASCPAGTWWPATYSELFFGPPDDDDWCRWIVSYYELLNGLPQFSCDIAECVIPYVRQFHSARITDGPTILNRRTMSVGEMAEIEFTIVCADPHEYTPNTTVAAFNTGAATGVPHTDPVFIPPPVNPFFGERLRRPRFDLGNPELPTDWTRYVLPITVESLTNLPAGVLPSFVLAAGGTIGRTRVSIVSGGEVVAGLSVPTVPSGSIIEIDGRSRTVWTEYDGERIRHNGFVRGVDGGIMSWADDIGLGDFDLVVDVENGSTGTLVAEVLAASVGCA